MSDHDHDHSDLSETELRVRALETILPEKGYVEPAALDAIIQAYETKIGPHNGAQVVAKAWSDPHLQAGQSPNRASILAAHRDPSEDPRELPYPAWGRAEAS